MDTRITLIVNGQERTVVTDPERPLLEVLREDLDVMGPKYGCGEGRCGACTVLMNGKRTRSCTTPVSMANKKKIITIEGLADGDRLLLADLLAIGWILRIDHGGRIGQPDFSRQPSLCDFLDEHSADEPAADDPNLVQHYLAPFPSSATPRVVTGNPS